MFFLYVGMKNIRLKYPPIKNFSNGRHSDKVVYHLATGKNVVTGELRDRFVMISTNKDCDATAIMECTKEIISRDGMTQVPSLFINRILSGTSGLGFGTAFLDFAREFSKKVGCLGNIHLSPNSGYKPNRIPHIFYWKYGMNTNDATVNRKLAKFVNQGKDATYLDFKDGVMMYYPPIKSPVTRWQKFINFIFDKEVYSL